MRVLMLSLTAALCACTTNQPGTPSPTTELSVATYNLYLGADLIALFPISQAQAAQSDQQFRDAVRMAFEAVDASRPVERMDAVAAQIAIQPADLIALQEVSLWQTQTPADGTATPASDVRYDFLALLVDSLRQRGLSYEIAVENRLTDVEVTGSFATPMDVRLIDRDVILHRTGGTITVASPETHDYETQLSAPSPQGTITVRRGWSAIQVNTAARSVRLINTHLEAAADPIRDAQAAELLLRTANESSLLMVGDFNFAPDSLPYNSTTTAGFADEWPVAHPNDPGSTCCQSADLRNPSSMLDTRIDLLFSRSTLHAAAAALLGNTPSAKTASGLWPSDHAGLHVDLGPQ